MTPNTLVPIIDGPMQARLEAVAAVREPRLEPSISEAEAVAEVRADLWTGLMTETPNDVDVAFMRMPNERVRPRSGPVVE